MKRLKHFLVSLVGLLFASTLFAATPPVPATPSPRLPMPASLAPLLANTASAIVNITVEKSIPSTSDSLDADPSQARPPRTAIGVGSGVIINAQAGLIITNAHVVKDQKVMIVTLKDGRRYHANLIGADDGFDVAIIRIHANHLTDIKFGDSNQLHVGDFVVAIGSPFDLTQTVTSGVISALNRDTPRIEGYQDFIQTDAPINPGNSGGALLNMKGQLIGINTAIITPTYGSIGIGFAIPSNMARSVIEQLIEYGKVSPGMLGVMAQDLTPELADALHLPNKQGVVVTQAVPGTPAAQAGIQPQDILLTVNNVAIRTSSQLHNLLGVMRPGTPIKITLLRNQKNIALETKVGDPNMALKQNQPPFLAGLRLTDYSDLEPDGSILKGTLVTDVADYSAGALAGLVAGDVITSANQQPVTSFQKLAEIAAQSKGSLLLKVTRDNSTLFLVIERNQ